MRRYCVSLVIVLFCFLSKLTTSLGGLSAGIYDNAVIERIESVSTRKIFEPSGMRDVSNVVLDAERNVVYVGAVNYLYALDADDVSVTRGEIYWAPDQLKLSTCINFKGDSTRCQNAIRILHSFNDTHIFACGTLAFSPTCIYVRKKDFTMPSGRPARGKWRSPEDPLSSAISAMSGSSLFTATTPSSPNKNGMICKTVEGTPPIKTSDNDKSWLSDPQFVSTFTVPDEGGEEKVIVLLKENAEEIPLEILTQDKDHSLNVVYSRLVSICANDIGGNPWLLKNKFATYTKMRISCPVEIAGGRSRNIPFFYDEIQSSFVLPNPKEPSNPTIYAIFTTPRGAVEATATCVFEMNDIRRYLSTSKYWNKPGKSTDLYSLYESERDDAPGKCTQDTTMLSAKRLTFGNEHPIKFGIIKPSGGYAVYQDAGITYSHILVDRIKRIEKYGGELVDKEYDVVHYITDSGFIKRVVLSTDDRRKLWEIPPRTLYKANEMQHKILTAKISSGYVYFGTTESLIQLRIASCSLYSSCADCSLANDPYCKWNLRDEACEEIDFRVPYKKLNETNCKANELNTNKKSGSTANLPENEELRILKEKFTVVTKQQNETIASLQTENDFLALKLAESMNELSNLMKNYSQLSALLLQYDARRKLVIQLYRNTVYSLHACQHERKQRKTGERKAALGVVERDNSNNFTNNDCITRKSESERCNCENEEETDVRLRNNGQVTERAAFTPSLESCHAVNSKLQQELSSLLSERKNLTKELTRLEKTVDFLKKGKYKLKAAVHRAKQNTKCGKDKWLLYQPTNKMFMVIRESASFYNAVEICAKHGGKIPEMKLKEEISFVHNLTQSMTPRKRYWIGLRKYENGTMLWSDGSIFDGEIAKRFSKNQKRRLSNHEIYCVETTNRVGYWQLLPCHKPRRVICTKEYHHNQRI